MAKVIKLKASLARAFTTLSIKQFISITVLSLLVIGTGTGVYLTQFTQQDIRQQAYGPTPTPTPSSQCFFGISSCPANFVPSTSCNPSSCPSGSAVCCTPTDRPSVDNCTYGNNYCNPSNDNQLFVCQTDPETGDRDYITVPCASNRYCPAGQRACVVRPTPTPSPSPTATPPQSTSTPSPSPNEPGECFFGISSCPTNMVPSSGCSSASCPSGSAICCKDTERPSVDNCTYGNNYCNPSNDNQLFVCQTDPETGDRDYITVPCASNRYCPAGQRACQILPELQTPTPTPGSPTESCSQLGARCCFDDRDYTLFCGGGLITNSSNPSDCRCRAPYTECTQGQRSCRDTTTLVCSSQGRWIDSTICQYRCSEGTCIQNLANGVSCQSDLECSSGICKNSKCTSYEQAITTDYCKELCIAGGNSASECGSLPSCPAAIGTVTACTGKSPGTYCTTQGKTGLCTNSGNCQLFPETVAAGGTCNTHAFNRTCSSGFECKNNVCAAIVAAQTGVNQVGAACEINSDCESGSCITTEYGWKECGAVVRIVDAGYQCGTTQYNQACKSPYQCINYICRVPVENDAPFDEYLEENADLLNPNSPTPTWGQTAAYIGASALNTGYNITGTIITQPGSVASTLASGAVDHFSNLANQGSCLLSNQQTACDQFTTLEKSFVAVNLLTLGGVQGLTNTYLNGGQAAMMNQYGYAWNDPRRWVDNAELGIAVTGAAQGVQSTAYGLASVGKTAYNTAYSTFENYATSQLDDAIGGMTIRVVDGAPLTIDNASTNQLYNAFEEATLSDPNKYSRFQANLSNTPGYAQNSAAQVYGTNNSSIADFVFDNTDDQFFGEVERIVQNANSEDEILENLIEFANNQDGVSASLNPNHTGGSGANKAIFDGRDGRVQTTVNNIPVTGYKPESTITGFEITIKSPDDTGSAIERATTLVHEMGHTAEYNAGAGLLLDDAGNQVVVTTEAISTAYALRFGEILLDNGYVIDEVKRITGFNYLTFNNVMYGNIVPQ